MEKNTTEMSEDYMKFVTRFHNDIRDQNIILVYEGEVTQSVTKTFSALTEQQMKETEDSSKTQKRLYHVMVECLQNVCKHADEEGGSPIYPGRGIFIVSTTDDVYTVTTGNIVTNEKGEAIKAMLNKFNSLDADEIKEEYKRMMKESRLSEKAGAGLGFIDIVKKTGNKIEYHFEKVNDRTSFFIQKSIINRD